MGEKMTLEDVRTLIKTAFRDSQIGMPVSLTHSEADSILRAIDAHLATPAQTVDIEAVREVVLQLRAYQNLHSEWPHAFPDMELDSEADKLSQAIGDKT